VSNPTFEVVHPRGAGGRFTSKPAAPGLTPAATAAIRRLAASPPASTPAHPPAPGSQVAAWLGRPGTPPPPSAFGVRTGAKVVSAHTEGGSRGWWAVYHLENGRRLRISVCRDGRPAAAMFTLRGEFDDPAPGVPAVRRWRRGRLAAIEHWSHGVVRDPVDGSPALVSYHPDGSVARSCHYRDGVPHDPAPGIPAEKHCLTDGTIVSVRSWQHGVPGPLAKM
jgi:hypothetical protein